MPRTPTQTAPTASDVGQVGQILSRLVVKLRKDPDTAVPKFGVPATADVVSRWVPRLVPSPISGDKIPVRDVPELLDHLARTHSHRPVAPAIVEAAGRITKLVGRSDR